MNIQIVLIIMINKILSRRHTGFIPRRVGITADKWVGQNASNMKINFAVRRRFRFPVELPYLIRVP